MINYNEYPPNWKTEIRPRIMARAGEVRDGTGKVIKEAECEWCHVTNHERGARDRNGKWRNEHSISNMNSGDGLACYGDWPKMVTIVLTVAHLDHDKLNHAVSDDRLAALCQKCHLGYDRENHLAVQRKNRERNKGPFLFTDSESVEVSHG